MKEKIYYHNDLKKLYQFLAPYGARALFISSDKLPKAGKYEQIVIDNLIGDLADVQEFLAKIKSLSDKNTKLIVTYYNHLWEPILKFASFMGWRKKVPEQNWLDTNDIKNILDLNGFEVISTQKRFLFPIYVPHVSDFINKWVAPLPVTNNLCLTYWIVARLKPKERMEYTTSIIIPARNEEGNILNIIPSIPKFGQWQEIIFVEGNSKDKTWVEIEKEIEKKHQQNIRVSAYKQLGTGKADAVRLGLSKAQGNILMIYDADRTVDAKDLAKFYEVLATGLGEFVNGSRMVYPMETQAMRMLNKIGNKIFSWAFTWILGQHFKDTLCGTKAFFKSDYKHFLKFKASHEKLDPFGDFDLIFGAIKCNLKVVEIPVRYRERIFGSTNINRFYHGWLLLKMTWLAFLNFKINI